jgi:outer membrane lipoprotein LolB
MKLGRQFHWKVLLASGLLLLSACATRTPELRPADAHFWSGRMALQIASQPPQSLSAGFELTSQQQTGELKLLSPLGSILAQLEWAPGRARLEQGGQIWQNNSLDGLLVQLTGAPLPMEALIDWLQAVPTQIPGWTADLTRIKEGKLWVQNTPSSSVPAPPQVTLQLIVEP